MPTSLSGRKGGGGGGRGRGRERGKGRWVGGCEVGKGEEVKEGENIKKKGLKSNEEHEQNNVD